MEKETSIHHKLFKFFVMPMLMIIIGVGQVWGQETTVSVTGSTFSFKDEQDNYLKIENDVFKGIATIKVPDKTGNRVKIAHGANFTIEAANNITITQVVIYWRQNSQCPTEENELIVSPESAGTFETSNLVTTWTGNVASGSVLTFTNNANKEIQFTGISITYTTGPVKTVPVLTLTGTPTLLKKGGTAQLTTTSDVEGLTYTYTSSNTSVATVSSTGKVTGIKSGEATITVTTKDGSKKATCIVTVDSSVTPDGPGVTDWENGTTNNGNATLQ
jgi:uncharacterized protein YjdB